MNKLFLSLTIILSLLTIQIMNPIYATESEQLSESIDTIKEADSSLITVTNIGKVLTLGGAIGFIAYVGKGIYITASEGSALTFLGEAIAPAVVSGIITVVGMATIFIGWAFDAN